MTIDENAEMGDGGGGGRGSGRSLYRSRNMRARSEAPMSRSVAETTTMQAPRTETERASGGGDFIQKSGGRPSADASAFARTLSVRRKRSHSASGRPGRSVMPMGPFVSRELLRSYRDSRDFQPDTASFYKTSASSWFDVPYRSHSDAVGGGGGIKGRFAWSRMTTATATSSSSKSSAKI